MADLEKKAARFARLKKWKKDNPDRVLESARRYREKHKDKILSCRNSRAEIAREYARQRRLTLAERLRNPTAYFFVRAKANANALSVEFNLDRHWVKTRLDNGVCEMSGLPFEY